MKQFEQNWLEELNDLIIDNLGNPEFQLADITRILKVSRAKLYRKVTKLTGLPPAEYVKKKRLSKAWEILKIGVYSTVKETSVAVGFRSPEYFTKQFYKEYRILPSELLKL